MRGIYKRIGGGLCALLLSLSLAGCDVPVDADVGAVLDSLTGSGSEGPSQAEESGKPHEESGKPHEENSKPQGESGPEAGSSSGQSRPQESSGTHQEKPGRPQQTSAPQESSAGEAKLLTEEQAKERALAHAQLSAGEVSFTKVKLDWEDGRQVYEIEFVSGDWMEYEYEIDAVSGDVLAWDREQEDAPAAKPTPRPTPRPTPQPTPQPIQTPAPEPAGISAEEAKGIALARVLGASSGDIVKFETDWDDGRIVYEGEILFGGMEYEFEIDGATGTVLDWDAEALDDD